MNRYSTLEHKLSDKLEKELKISTFDGFGRILSFAAELEPFNISAHQNEIISTYSNVFYWSSVDSGKKILAFGELLSIQIDEPSFSNIQKEVEKLKSKFTSNYSEFAGRNFPAFFTAIRFPSDKNSSEWSDFKKINLLIPQSVLLQEDGKYYFIKNLLLKNQDDVESFIENPDSLNFSEKSLSKSSDNNRTELKVINRTENSENWDRDINYLLNKIESGELKKVVLARKVNLEIEGKISWEDLFDKLDSKYSNCINFLFKNNDSIFFGSSPEKLGSFLKGTFLTEALAGSIKRGSDPNEDKDLEEQLTSDEKNKLEHQFVIDHLRERLKNHLSEIEIDENPTVKKLQNIQHLQTKIKGRLINPSSFFKTINDLFPTPAVCGVPKEKTIEVINEIEKFDRGLFSGIIGWFNENNDGEFAVTIRSALNQKNKIIAYAGCGIVKGSDPAEEFEETNMKLRPILSLFTNETKSK